ncbi:MAG: methyltransferase domain-containing protein, partial [Nitrospiria bacterium]
DIRGEIKLHVLELLQTFRSPTTQKEPLKDQSWSRYYQEEKTAWDLGEPSPPFVRLYREGALKKGKMAVPGCGKGHEALFFAKEGFEVTAIDFTGEAIRIVRDRLQREGLHARLIQADFLKLDRRFDEKFDTILEQTCYCAIEPVKRADYVRTVHRLLRPGGEYIALFYDIENIDGPPFGTSSEEIRQRFDPYFKIEQLEKTAFSHNRRAGKEWLARFQKPG